MTNVHSPPDNYPRRSWKVCQKTRVKYHLVVKYRLQFNRSVINNKYLFALKLGVARITQTWYVSVMAREPISFLTLDCFAQYDWKGKIPIVKSVNNMQAVYLTDLGPFVLKS